MAQLPPLPASLGRQVTTRDFNLLEMVERAWGSEFSAPDHRVYCFGNGVRCFDSTDLGTTGIYARGVSTATAVELTGNIDEENSTAIDLSWSLSSIVGSLIDYYQIWRSVDGDPFALLVTLEAYDPDFVPAYTDANLNPGSEYEYYVIAVPCVGNNSPQSNIVDVTLPAQATVPVLSGEIIAGPTNELNWTASTVPGSVINAYDIFRSIDGGSFSQYASVAGNVLTFQDPAADPTKHSYTYYVVAIPDAGQDSAPSNQVTLTEAGPASFLVESVEDFIAFPFAGTWETGGAGYSNNQSGTYIGMNNIGATNPADPTYQGSPVLVVGEYSGFGIGPPVVGDTIIVMLPSGFPQDAFTSVNMVLGATNATFLSASADFFDNNYSDGHVSPAVTVWAWTNPGATLFSDGLTTSVTITP